MKTGYKTTEFWLSLIAVLVGALLASGAISNDYVLQILGVAASTLGALGYSGLRTKAKADLLKNKAFEIAGGQDKNPT